MWAGDSVAVRKSGAEPPHSKGRTQGEHTICFLFAFVVAWASSFSTGALRAVFRAVF